MSPVAVGTKVVSVEPDVWEGIWRGPDDVEVSLEVLNPKEGVVALSWSEVVDGEETFKRTTAYFRSMSGVLFVSAELPMDDDGNTGYVWGKVERNGNEVFIVPPSFRLFRDLVERGELRGKTAPEAVVLHDVQTTDIDLLLMKWRFLFFDQTKPLAFTKAAEAFQ